MNVNTAWQVAISLIRNIKLKAIHGDSYNCRWLYSCPVGTKIRIHRGGSLCIGNHLSAQKGVLISVLPGASLIIGNGLNINTNCAIVARDKITIGDNVIFGPDCKVYDHDHDYKKVGYERRNSFVTSEVSIGNGVWFGANCVVLKGTTIGDNCVFGAGSIIKGEYPSNTLVIQERNEKRKTITSLSEE